MSINWENERELYPAVTKQTYLLTGAVGPISKNVYASYQNHYRSLYEVGDINWMENVETLDLVREQTARFLGATGAHEIAFTANTSMAMNLLAMTFKSRLEKANKPLKILSCNEEFPSTTIPWLHHGFEVIQVPAANLADEAEKAPAPLVVASAVQFGTGYRQDLVSLGKICKASKTELVVNGTQAMGAFPIDVKEMGISALTVSCHKWMCCGYGLSIMYLAEELLPTAQWPIAGWLSVEDPLLMDNRAHNLKQDASALEVGIPMFSLIAALGTQLTDLERLGIKNIGHRILEISAYAYSKLNPHFKVITSRTESPNLASPDSGTILFESQNAEAIADQLNQRNIHVSVRQGGLRITTHFYNNKADIDHLVDGLKEIL